MINGVKLDTKKFHQATDTVDHDVYSLLDQRNQLHLRLRTFCQQHKIGVLSPGFYPENIAKIRHDVIVYMWLMDEVPHMDTWIKVNQICAQTGKHVYVITDNILEWTDLEYVHFRSQPELLGITANFNNCPIDDYPVDTLYNCLVQRTDSIRLGWIYFLYSEGLLDQGFVSCLCKQLESYSKKTGVDLFDYIHYHYNLDQLPHFDQAYHALRDKMPFRNFAENSDTVSLIKRSKYSLILETYAMTKSQGTWCFTEKTLKPLQFATHSLAFVPKHGVKKIEELGLIVGYNQHDELEWTERQKNLLAVIKQDQLPLNYPQLVERAKHNRNILETWKQQIHHPNYFDNLFDELQNS